MTDPMLIKPEPAAYRWALYCRSHLLDLTNEPQPPVALYSDSQLAHSHGAALWPATYAVVDLHGDDRP